MSPKERQFDEKVINEVRKRVRFQVNTFKITGREPFVSFVIINLVRRNLSYSQVTVIQHEGLRPEELMCHTAKKVSSCIEESFISVHF